MEKAESEFAWARRVLANDPLYRSMGPEDELRAIKESAQFGRHLAEKTLERLGKPLGTEGVKSMLVSLGCGVRVNDETGLPGPMSEYEEDLLSARFYTLRIRNVSQRETEKGNWSAGWYELYAQCLARELFHHVENTLSGKASHHIRLQDRLLGIIPVSRPVEESRNIACLIFVQKFLELSSLPLLMLEP